MIKMITTESDMNYATALHSVKLMPHICIGALCIGALCIGALCIGAL